MESKNSISHAQSLRVIGQHLDVLGATFFQICKQGSDLIVVTRRDRSAQVPVTAEEFLNTCTEQNRRPERIFAEAAKPIHFAISDMTGLDIRARLRRSLQADMMDVRNLSSNLRVLGGYLDRKRVSDFIISWLNDSVKVVIHGKEHTFSVHQNLYDLGVSMYLNRFHGFGDGRKITAT